jgi:hypothetical protein
VDGAVLEGRLVGCATGRPRVLGRLSRRPGTGGRS